MLPTPVDPAPVVASETKITLNGRWLNPPIESVNTPVTVDGAVSFDVYCNFKRIPADHRKGMRHYCDRKVATVAEWDLVFAAY